MNTVEMLAAAAKYVNFLRAQVGILQFLKHASHARQAISLSLSLSLPLFGTRERRLCYIWKLENLKCLNNLLMLVEEEACAESSNNMQLHQLLSSPAMQKKLYGEEMCMVTLKSVRSLAKDPDLQKSESISKDLKKMIRQSGDSSNGFT